MGTFAVVLPAAGKSTRFGGPVKKTFAELDGQPVWLRAVKLFANRPDVCQTLLVIDPDDRELFLQRHGVSLNFLSVDLVDGGAERFESVANALALLSPEAEYVAVHDAVRPCTPVALIDAVFAAARHHGASVPALPVADTVKRASDDLVVEATVPRANLWLAQTPQAFRKDWLLEAYAKRGATKGTVTDDAQLVESAGREVRLVPGAAANFKITTPFDLTLAEAVLKAQAPIPEKRAAHPFAEDDMWS